jgi:amino acid permease
MPIFVVDKVQHCKRVCLYFLFNLTACCVHKHICFSVTGIPYALHQAGFGAGLFLLVFVALATDYSLVLMIRSGHLSGAFSYQGLMEAAFGKPGFILLSLLQFIYPFIGNYKSMRITELCDCFLT